MARIGARIDHDSALAGVVMVPPQALFHTGRVGNERCEPARRMSVRGLHKDDFGPKVTKKLACHSCMARSELDDAQTRQHPLAHRTPPATSASISAASTPRIPPNTSRLCSPRQGAPRSMVQSVAE